MNPKEIFSAAALLVVIASSLAAQTLFPANNARGVNPDSRLLCWMGASLSWPKDVEYGMIWSAVAERSGDTALDSPIADFQASTKAPSPLRFAGALQIWRPLQRAPTFILKPTPGPKR